MRRPCYVVDSFAAHALAGNPAGVLLDGAELDANTMQRIASELRHSETVFPLPAREPTAAFHLRWFTPESEVAFCGHATLAAFHVLVEEAPRHRGSRLRRAPHGFPRQERASHRGAVAPPGEAAHPDRDPPEPIRAG